MHRRALLHLILVLTLMTVIGIQTQVGRADVLGPDGMKAVAWDPFPGDNRVNPAPGDRVAIYCNGQTGTIDVWGIRNDSSGFYLTNFLFKNVTAAGLAGVRNKPGNYGVVSLAEISPYRFYLAWNGGPFGANGQGSWAKTFDCAFAQPSLFKTATPNPALATLAPTATATLAPSPTPTLPAVATQVKTTVTVTGTFTGRQTYVVQPGDNLFRIALRFGVPLSVLAAANGITNPNLIFVGQVLVIP